MARRHYQEEPEPSDRWLVSYADFITLLFAFFVVLYAMSSVQEQKVNQLSQSIGHALGMRTAQRPPLAPPGVAQPTESSTQRAHRQMKTMALALDERLSALVRQGSVRVTRSIRGINIEINAAILFAPAEARLNPASIAALESIADVLRSHSNAIEVEGHTDNQAINTAAYPSNWELSAARASRVVRLLLASGIDETRLLAIGHAANRPVASNDTTEGRLRNRRVEIQVLSNRSNDKRSSAD